MTDGLDELFTMKGWGWPWEGFWLQLQTKCDSMVLVFFFCLLICLWAFSCLPSSLSVTSTESVILWVGHSSDMLRSARSFRIIQPGTHTADKLILTFRLLWLHQWECLCTTLTEQPKIYLLNLFIKLWINSNPRFTLCAALLCLAFCHSLPPWFTLRPLGYCAKPRGTMRGKRGKCGIVR